MTPRGDLGNLPTHQRAGVAEACGEGSKHGAITGKTGAGCSAQLDAMGLVLPFMEMSADLKAA